MIYLDQAATSFPKIKEVQDAVIDCMNHCTNANRSTSTTSLNASRLIYQTRKLIKEYFHVPHFEQYHSSSKYHFRALVFQFQQLDKFHPSH